MKIKGLIVLISILLGVLSPLSITVVPAEDGTYIVSLDVCHASGSSISANAETPVVYEGLYDLIPPGFTGFLDTKAASIYISIIALLKEYPPEA